MPNFVRSRVVFFLAVMIACGCTSSIAQANAGCKNRKFIGSYTHLFTSPDVWGDGTNVEHQVITQLNLHSDGTATQDYSGSPDLILSGGMSTTAVGVWTCRNDGMLVVTVIFADYLPTTDAVNHPPVNVPFPLPVDLFLYDHVRATWLFSVTDANTLTRIQGRTRRYLAAEDPTDPNGGSLERLRTGAVVYTRLVASDADLLAP